MIRNLALGVAALLLVPGWAAAQPQTAQEYPDPGDGVMYVGTYEGNIYVLDEATGQVTGAIDLETGIPRSITLNHDGTRFYVLNIDYERMEVVDVPSRRTVDTFSLSEGNEQVRIWSFAPNPGETRAVLVVRRYRRLVDRWDVDETELLLYDLVEHEVVRSLPWPDGEPLQRASMAFSPDGGLLYFFLDDIVAYETERFTEVDRWDFGRSLDFGMGEFDFGFPDSPYEEDGWFTGLFETEDPVNARPLMGVARVNLAERDVRFSTLGPAENLRFTLAPNGKAYGLHVAIGNHQLWTIDLASGTVERRVRIPGRTRMRLESSSNGAYLYVWQAGNTIDLIDVETGEYVHTIELDADTTTDLIVVPNASGPTGAAPEE